MAGSDRNDEGSPRANDGMVGGVGDATTAGDVSYFPNARRGSFVERRRFFEESQVDEEECTVDADEEMVDLGQSSPREVIREANLNADAASPVASGRGRAGAEVGPVGAAGHGTSDRAPGTAGAGPSTSSPSVSSPPQTQKRKPTLLGGILMSGTAGNKYRAGTDSGDGAALTVSREASVDGFDDGRSSGGSQTLRPSDSDSQTHGQQTGRGDGGDGGDDGGGGGGGDVRRLAPKTHLEQLKLQRQHSLDYSKKKNQGSYDISLTPERYGLLYIISKYTGVRHKQKVPMKPGHLQTQTPAVKPSEEKTPRLAQLANDTLTEHSLRDRLSSVTSPSGIPHPPASSSSSLSPRLAYGAPSSPSMPAQSEMHPAMNTSSGFSLDEQLSSSRSDASLTAENAVSSRLPTTSASASTPASAHTAVVDKTLLSSRWLRKSSTMVLIFEAIYNGFFDFDYAPMLTKVADELIYMNVSQEAMDELRTYQLSQKLVLNSRTLVFVCVHVSRKHVYMSGACLLRSTSRQSQLTCASHSVPFRYGSTWLVSRPTHRLSRESGLPEQSAADDALAAGIDGIRHHQFRPRAAAAPPLRVHRHH